MQRPHKIFRLSLTIITYIWVIELLMWVFSIQLREALGDPRATFPDIGQNTFELLSYQASGYKFQVIPQHTEPPAGFEQPGFDDTVFDTGTAAFGAGGGGAGNGIDCPLHRTSHTQWPLKTQLLVRHEVTIPTDTTNIRVMVSVDNDIRGVFFNGSSLIEHTLAKRSVTHEECPVLDEFRFDVPPDLVRTGSNLLALHIVDRGPMGGAVNESFFDARVLAELSPNQLLDAVVVQQAPLVPVRDVAVDSRIGPDGTPSSVTITYAVAATAEFGEIRIEQSAADTLTAASFLGGELIAKSTASPDAMTMSRSLRAAERFADLEPGILSIPSIFTNQTALGGLFQFDASSLALASCIAACGRQAEMASTSMSLLGGIRNGSCQQLSWC